MFNSLNKNYLTRSFDTSYQVFFVQNENGDLVFSNVNWPLFYFQGLINVDTIALDYLVEIVKELVFEQQTITISKADIYEKTKYYFKRAYKLDHFLFKLQELGYIHLFHSGVIGRKQIVVLNPKVLFH